MRIIRDFQSCPPESQGAVVALGNFDGVHKGHQEILDQCIAAARAYKVPAAVMTFEPHPREFFSKTHERLRLCSFRRKVALMEEMGIDTMFLVRFNRQFSSLSAANFVDEVLHQQLAVKHVVTGYNFAFGKNRTGTTDYLETRAHEFEFGFTACPPVQDDGGVISSSAIRHLLAGGEVKKAASLLGRPYVMEGRVRRGHQRGRSIGFPTANISLNRLFKPRFGVYAVRATINDGKAYDAIANIGVKPTVGGGEQPLLEVHFFDTSQEMYGKIIQVTAIDFIRDERKFDSLEALKAQIGMDCIKARGMLYAGA